jgi:soluble lytic murein transglycosylase-like protein
MRYLIITLILASILATPTSQVSAETIPLFMTNAANAFNIDVALMYSICQQESKCRANAINHSDGTKKQKAVGLVKKSYGLFQMQYATAQSLGFKGKPKDLLKPETNAWYAAKLLRSLYKRFKGTPEVISAFNAGHPVKHNVMYVHYVIKNYIRFKIDRTYDRQ